MPRIPEKRSGYNQQSYGDPTIRTDGAGMVNRAIQQAAGQVSDFTIGLMTKRKQAQDSNYAFNKYMEDFEATSRYEEQLKVDEGANPDTYAQKMREFTAERMTQGLENAPSDEAKDLYNRKSMPLFTKSTLDAESYQNIKKAEYYFKSKQDNIDAASNALLDNPNYIKASELQGQLDADYENDVNLYGETVAKQSLVTNKNKLAMGVLDGLETGERYAEAIKLLTDNEAEGKITNEIAPEKKAQLLKRYNRGLESKKMEYNSELRRQVNDRYAAALKGDLDSNGITQLEAQIDASPFKAPEKARLIDALKVAKTISPAINEMTQMPANEWQNPDKLIASLPENFNESDRMRAKASLAQAQMRDLSERRTDGAAYVMKNFPGIAAKKGEMNGEALVESVMFKQQELGIENPRPLPVNEIKYYADSLAGAKPAEINETLAIINNQFGKHTGAVMSQLVKDGKVDADYMLVGGLPNPSTRERIIENIKNKKEYATLIKQDSSLNAERKTLKDQIPENAEYRKLKSMIRSNDTSRAPFVSGIHSQIMIEADRNILNGDNAGTALDNAVQRVFTDNYIALEDNNGATLIPRAVNNGSGNFEKMDEAVVKSFIQTHKSPKYFDSANIQVPASYSKMFAGDMNDTKIKERFYADLNANSYWDLGADQRSLILKYQDPNSKEVIAVQDMNKKVIKHDLVDIHTIPDEFLADSYKEFWPETDPLGVNKVFNFGNKATSNE